MALQMFRCTLKQCKGLHGLTASVSVQGIVSVRVEVRLVELAASQWLYYAACNRAALQHAPRVMVEHYNRHVLPGCDGWLPVGLE